MRSYIAPRRHQNGVSLLIVLVMMLLSALLVMGGARVTHLNEFMAGNDVDHQRAFEAAQMMLQNAELDIQAAEGNRRTTYVSKMDADHNSDLITLASSQTGSVKCVDGVCSNLDTLVSGDPETSFWNDPTLLAQFAARGATYRQWTHASPLATDAAETSNPILASTELLPSTTVRGRAWYWIEILEFEPNQLRDAPAWVQACIPAQSKSSDGERLFRITAVALGRSLTPTVVQEYFVPKPNQEGRCP